MKKLTNQGVGLRIIIKLGLELLIKVGFRPRYN